MEILIVAFVIMLFVGAAFTGKRLAYLHAGKVDSFFPKRRTKERNKWDFRRSRMKVHPHDWSDPTNVTESYDELFDNKLERYARFLELRLKFDSYDRKSAEERGGMILEARKPTVTPKPDGGNIVVLGDCRFLCGTAPCGCEQDWGTYKLLCTEFTTNHGEVIHRYPVHAVSLIDVLFEMKNPTK